MGRWDDERREREERDRWRGSPEDEGRRDERERRGADREPLRDTGRGGEYERGRERADAWREERGRWRGGDYTTYGLSGYRDDDELRRAHEDFVHEQGHGIYQEEERRRAFERSRGMRPRTGRGPKGFRRSDDRIFEEVCERIARSGIDAEDVEVQVDRGEVSLSGEVETRVEKRLLEDLADEVFGVEDVHNRLRLRRRPARETHTSPERPAGEAQQQGRGGERDDPSTRH